MFRILLVLFISLYTSIALSDEILKTPNSEVEDALKYLVGNDKSGKAFLNEVDKPFIRFFSTYAIPDEKKKQDTVLTLSFVLHSLVGPSKDLDSNNAGGYKPLAYRVNNTFIPLQNVPFSNTLWWIDLRDYNFTPESWEVAAGLDSYFITPIVQEQNNGALRLIAGNAILRADWFIVNVTNSTRQRDNGKNFDLYTNFLFAQVTPPKNADEWQKFFALDQAKARTIGNEVGTIVTKSKAIARHNRALMAYKTEFGYTYHSYDVKNQDGVRDYFEGFFTNKKIGTPPDTSDAGEIIATNQLGLQVYAIRDEKGNLLNVADATIVRNIADHIGDVRVRISDSCMVCHSAGPLPAENTINELLKSNMDIYLSNITDRNRVKRTFLDGRFEDSIEYNKTAFAKALEKCNGLTPLENESLYLQSIEDYSNNVNLKKAAFECGVSEETFKSKVLEGRFGGRLKLLVQTGESIPRDIFESRGANGIPGAFAQAMILINGVTKVTDTLEASQDIPKDILNIIIVEDTQLMVGRNSLGVVPKDTKLSILDKQNGFVKVEFNGKLGWVLESKTKIK